MVVTKDMSRLGRDYIQTGYYLEKFFPSHGVRYISLLDGIDTGIDSGINDITPFKAIMNDMYAKDISKKITSVKRDKQRKGLFIGGKAPYGYKLSVEQKNVIEIDPPAAAVVRRMFSLAVGGVSGRQIAVILNNEGIPTPAQYANINITRKGVYSGKWSAERISFMLKNEVYIGNMVQGRIRQINYKIKTPKKLPPEEWTIVKNTHPPLVESEVFDKVQLLIASRNNTRVRTHDFLLKGLIFCHECGYPLGVIQRKLAGDKLTLYFVCKTYQRFTKEYKCTCHCIRVETVTQAVMEQIRAICEKELDRERCTEQVKDISSRHVPSNLDSQQEIQKVESKITELTDYLDRIYDDRLAGTLEEGDFRRIYDKIKQERLELQDKIKNLQSRKESNSTLELNAKARIQEFLDTVDTNKELLVSLVSRIELTENKEIKIFFRFSSKTSAHESESSADGLTKARS